MVVEEFDAFDRDEEFESHFALASVEFLELVGRTAHCLHSIQLLHLCKPVPLHVCRFEKEGSKS